MHLFFPGVLLCWLLSQPKAEVACCHVVLVGAAATRSSGLSGYKQQKFTSQFRRMKVQEQWAGVAECWWGPPSSCLLPTSRCPHTVGVRQGSAISFIRTLIPLKRTPTWWANLFLEAPPRNIISLGIGLNSSVYSLISANLTHLLGIFSIRPGKGPKKSKLQSLGNGKPMKIPYWNEKIVTGWKLCVFHVNPGIVTMTS